MELKSYLIPASKMEIAQKIYDDLDTFEYGTIIKGKRFGEDELDKVDWSLYRTLPISVIEKERIGNCWDFVNYQHHLFKKNKIQDSSYMMVMDRGEKGVVTHTFSIITINNQKYWFEQAFYKKRGIHKISSVKDVITELCNHYDPEGKMRFDVYQYNPDGLDRNKTDQEFFDIVTSSKRIAYRE